MENTNDLYPAGVSQVSLLVTLNKSRKLLRLFFLASALILIANIVFIIIH